MDDLRQENEKVKEFLAEAMEIAEFTIYNHGIFIKQQYSRLKAKVSKTNLSIKDENVSNGCSS